MIQENAISFHFVQIEYEILNMTITSNFFNHINIIRFNCIQNEMIKKMLHKNMSHYHIISYTVFYNMV